MTDTESERVAIIGDGQMGLVLSDALVRQGAAVRLWSPFPDDAAALQTARTSPRLPGFSLPESVEVVGDDAEATAEATLIVNAIPTQFITSVWARLGPHLPGALPVVCVSKGIENHTLRTPAEVITHAVHAASGRAVAVCALSGPTIAAELADRKPATMVAASIDQALARRVQEVFGAPWLRIYRHDDLVGVEVAGAAKNVIALAAGMVDGLDAGINAKSALLARGLAEISRLGLAMGARIDTFFGVAGVGDLATTCFSPHGRNRTCGERLGRGETLEHILETMVSVVEGVPTTRSVVALAERHGVEMPITAAVHAILFEGLSPVDAIHSLMKRERGVERIG